MAISIDQKCTYCDGTGSRVVGYVPPGETGNLIPCSECNGTGITQSEQQISDSLEEKLAEIKTKCDQIQADTNKIWAKVKNL
jgi:DnaJ-class molecular chaperone